MSATGRLFMSLIKRTAPKTIQIQLRHQPPTDQTQILEVKTPIRGNNRYLPISNLSNYIILLVVPVVGLRDAILTAILMAVIVSITTYITKVSVKVAAATTSKPSRFGDKNFNKNGIRSDVIFFGSTGWARTSNQLLNRQLLYH